MTGISYSLVLLTESYALCLSTEGKSTQKGSKPLKSGYRSGFHRLATSALGRFSPVGGNEEFSFVSVLLHGAAPRCQV